MYAMLTKHIITNCMHIPVRQGTYKDAAAVRPWRTGASWHRGPCGRHAAPVTCADVGRGRKSTPYMACAVSGAPHDVRVLYRPVRVSVSPCSVSVHTVRAPHAQTRRLPVCFIIGRRSRPSGPPRVLCVVVSGAWNTLMEVSEHTLANWTVRVEVNPGDGWVTLPHPLDQQFPAYRRQKPTDARGAAAAGFVRVCLNCGRAFGRKRDAKSHLATCLARAPRPLQGHDVGQRERERGIEYARAGGGSSISQGPRGAPPPPATAVELAIAGAEQRVRIPAVDQALVDASHGVGGAVDVAPVASDQAPRAVSPEGRESWSLDSRSARSLAPPPQDDWQASDGGPPSVTRGSPASPAASRRTSADVQMSSPPPSIGSKCEEDVGSISSVEDAEDAGDLPASHGIARIEDDAVSDPEPDDADEQGSQAAIYSSGDVLQSELLFGGLASRAESGHHAVDMLDAATEVPAMNAADKQALFTGPGFTPEHGSADDALGEARAKDSRKWVNMELMHTDRTLRELPAKLLLL